MLAAVVGGRIKGRTVRACLGDTGGSIPDHSAAKRVLQSESFCW